MGARMKTKLKPGWEVAVALFIAEVVGLLVFVAVVFATVWALFEVADTIIFTYQAITGD